MLMSTHLPAGLNQCNRMTIVTYTYISLSDNKVIIKLNQVVLSSPHCVLLSQTKIVFFLQNVTHPVVTVRFYNTNTHTE